MKKIFLEVFITFIIMISSIFCQGQNENTDNSSKCNIENNHSGDVLEFNQSEMRRDERYSNPDEDIMLRKKGDLIMQGGLDIPIINLYALVRMNITNSVTIGLNYGSLFAPLGIEAIKFGLNLQKYIRPADHMSGYFELSSGPVWEEVNHKNKLNGIYSSFSFGLNWYSQKGLNTDLYVGGSFLSRNGHSNIFYPFAGVRFGLNIFNY
jgi:hypothetical protein